jgi:2-methylisocitrate lyase-like PEP mutase family enzyme
MTDFLKRPQSRNAKLRELLRNKPLIVPGAHDGLSARLVEQAGFDAVYMGGYATTGALLGRPDMSLLTGTEMIENARRMAQAVSIPVIADADTGYGNAINVIRTVHDYEQTGVSGIHLEDQTAPKRCGHMDGKNVITAGEMVGKVKAAVAAKSDPDFVIIARTDALAIHGVDDAIERGRRYADAGADVIWVEAPTTEAQMERITNELPGITVLLNWLEHGETPNIPLDKIKQYGFGVVIYPIGSVLTVLTALREHYASVRRVGTPVERLPQLAGFDDFTSAVGKPDIDKLAQRFADPDATDASLSGSIRLDAAG